MKTLFHIGMAKTGSSALQDALFHSAGYLAERGILYPQDPDRPRARNHKLFASQIAPLDRLPRHMGYLGDAAAVEALFRSFHAHLKATIAARQPELVLLSSETMFSRIHDGYQRKLHAAITELGADPVFVAYLRRPSDRYLSGLQQHLRAASTIEQPRSRNYRINISGYEALFGEGSVRLHIFHRDTLKEGDVVTDFAARYLTPFGVERARLAEVGEVNVSISAESMAIMQSFRATFHATRENLPTKGSDRLRATLRAADAAVGAPRPRLRPEIAEAIDHSTDDPLWLRDRYGLVFPGFDYRPLEEGRLKPLPEGRLGLEDIVLIDREVQRAILEALATADWVVRRPRRRRWLAGLARAA